MSEPRIRVLCIDDEARILRALKALFRDMDVSITTDPAEAIRLAAEKDIDVVVCDQRMPKMQGIEVLREIRMSHPRAMRILLTGYADLNAVLGSVNEGEVFRYINKPWDNTELKVLLHLAFEHLDLQREHRHLLAMVRTQSPLLAALRRRTEQAPHAAVELPEV